MPTCQHWAAQPADAMHKGRAGCASEKPCSVRSDTRYKSNGSSGHAVVVEVVAVEEASDGALAGEAEAAEAIL